MGKNIIFYCLDLSVPHSKYRKPCVGWDYQPEDDRKDGEISDALGAPMCARTIFDALLDGTVCDRCAWFYQGPVSKTNKMILDTYDVSHSYSSSKMRSDFFIENFVHLGTSAREYDRGSGQKKRYTEHDVHKMREAIEDLGKPIRDSDREAYDESLSVLHWMDSMFEKHSGKVIDVLCFAEY